MKGNLLLIAIMFNSWGSGAISGAIANYPSSHAKNRLSHAGVIENESVNESNFVAFWEKFRKVIRRADKKAFESISLDSVVCDHRVVGIKAFQRYYYSKVFDARMLVKLTDTSKVNFIDFTMDDPSLSPLIVKRIKPGIKIIKQVSIMKFEKEPQGPVTIVLEFIETKFGYRFYGYDKF